MRKLVFSAAYLRVSRTLRQVPGLNRGLLDPEA